MCSARPGRDGEFGLSAPADSRTRDSTPLPQPLSIRGHDMTLPPVKRPPARPSTGPSALAAAEPTELRRDLRAARRRDRAGIAVQVLVAGALIAAAFGTVLFLLMQR